MKFLNLSVAFISKLKRNHILSSCEKISYFRRKGVLKPTFSSFCFSPYRCFSVKCKTDPLSSNGGKRFQEIENEYAHQVMENLSYYSSSLLKFPLQNDNFTSKTGELTGHLNIVDRFAQVTLHNLTEGCNLEDLKFTDLIEKVCCILPETSDENIKKVLHYLCMWPAPSSTMTPNFKMLWNLLDQECVKRLQRWNVSQKLLIGDYWFYLKLSRITHYNSALIYDLIQNIDSLSNHQVVQLMFYIILQRQIPDHFVHTLENKLELIINHLTLEEVGIVCLGFFKTQNKISNANLVQSIIKQFMHNVENLNTVTVSAILKFLRISLNLSFIDSYILTLHKCVSCIDNFDIPTSVHLALLSSECNVYHPLLLNCVSEKLCGEMHNARIKDCAKFLFCLSLYNHCGEKFQDRFLVKLKQENADEFISYPKQVVFAMLYYSYMGLYNYDLLAKIFEKDFIKKTCLLSPEMQVTFVEIDYCVEIECPDYTGPKLDASNRKLLHSRRGNLPSKSKTPNMQTRLLSNIYDSLVEILGGTENVLIRHILPHVYSPDIIVRLSGNKEKSLPDLCQGVPADIVLNPPKDEDWAAFVVCNTYSFAYRSTQMTAIPAMKLRQLQKIGYHVTCIPYFNVYRNTARRKDFLKEKLSMLEEKLQTVVL